MLKQKCWLFLLILVLAGCTTQETGFPISTPTSLPALVPVEVSEVIQRDAEVLAAEFGISIDEAIHRILMMESSGELNARLEQNETDTFAGMWLLHRPDFRVVVAFTRDGETTLQPYVENTILAGSIEVREVAVTQAELYAIEMKANQMVNQLGLSLVALTLVNIQDNRVEIRIPDRSLLDDRLAAARLELPDHVEIVTSQTAAKYEPPPNLTPVPGVYFPQLIAPPSVVFALSVNGELVLEGDCLRLGRSPDEPGDLLVWQPGHWLNSNLGVVEVLDQTGEVVARVGEISCFSPAAGELGPDDSDLLRVPLPDSCAGPNFLVGEVQLGYREGQDTGLVEVELVSMEEGGFYFIRGMSDLEDWFKEPAALSGKLVHNQGSRCLHLQRESGTGFQDYLVFWPPDYTIRDELGAVTIINGLGELVGVLNEEVRLFGSLVMAEQEIQESLIQKLPCDCAGGDYWVVVGDHENP